MAYQQSYMVQLQNFCKLTNLCTKKRHQKEVKSTNTSFKHKQTAIHPSKSLTPHKKTDTPATMSILQFVVN